MLKPEIIFKYGLTDKNNLLNNSSNNIGITSFSK